jgi:RHS repeat-associated protein
MSQPCDCFPCLEGAPDLSFDAAARQTRILDPLYRPTTVTYDAASRLIQRLDARNNPTTYVFDDANRLINRHYPDGSRVTFVFDPVNRRTLLNDTTGRTTSTYDDVDRLRTVVNPANKTITYAYDAVSQRVLVIEPGGGRFTSAFDAAGRIGNLVNSQLLRATWTYDDANRVSSTRMGNGTRASYTYDDADRLLRLANVRADNTTISSFAYQYDPAGNRTRVIENSGAVVTWTYDNLYQLTQEQRSVNTAYVVTHIYDAVGNQLVKAEKPPTGSIVRTTFTFDAGNQLINQTDNTGVTVFTFDANGNQILSVAPSILPPGPRTTWTWDFENRLTLVQLPSGVRNTSVYNADGHRVQKQDSTGTTKPIWDNENVLLQTDQNDITQALYTLEPATYGNLLSQFQGAVTTYFHFDGLGSTDRITDSSGLVTANYIYEAFGPQVGPVPGDLNPFRFVGRQGYYLDVDLAQYYVRARHYDPVRGRFLSEDPLGFLPEELNLYKYVSNNPIRLADPSGLQGGGLIYYPWASMLPYFEVLSIVVDEDFFRRRFP